MKIKISADAVEISGFNYRMHVKKDGFSLIDPRTGHLLMATDNPLVFYPEFYGQEPAWEVSAVDAVASDSGSSTITVSGNNGKGSELKVQLICWPDHIELAADVTAPKDCRIAFWYLLGQNLKLDLFHIHHWRNRHGHTATYETYNLLQGGKKPEEVTSPGMSQEVREANTRIFDITTYSYDWQFNPRPSFMLFQRDTVMLGIGARDLPQSFGLELRAAARKLEYLRYNYGGEYGLEIAGGKTARAPRTYLWLDHNLRVWDSVDHYVEMLMADGEIPCRAERDFPHWWFSPAYCTWGDQGYLSGNSAYYNFPGDKFKGKHPVTSFDAAMLDHLIDTLEKEQFGFGYVIIDDGWQKTRGDWFPHPEKFPELRAQIDRIHALGMKVMLWLAPFDFYADANTSKKAEWLCGEGTLGRHGMPMVDFSNPKVQQEYLEPLARSFFSAEEGCLDADGLKLDFMADKIHPVFPVNNPEWQGEERFTYGWQSLTYKLMKKWKPDGLMLGGTVHPHFIDCQDMVRTYDVPGSQFQHADRAVMIGHFNPGNLIALDMSETKSLADVEEHFGIAFKYNLLYECGKIAPDPATGVHKLGEEYYLLLKRKLEAW